jgi:hypothetical protein
MFKHLRIYVLSLLLLGNAWAHGDEDHSEHSHAAPGTVLQTSSVVPTLTAQSDQFELVARLYADELGLYIDDWATNTPVLHGDVEVEFNGRKAVAKFHSDHGDYALADAEMLKALSAEGEHGLLFTIIAGKKSDLLTGTLVVKHDEHAASSVAKSWLSGLLWLAGAVVLVLFGLVIRKALRSRKEKGL